MSVCVYRESTSCVSALPYFHCSHTFIVHNISDTQSNGKKTPYFLFTYIHNTLTRGACVFPQYQAVLSSSRHQLGVYSLTQF